MESTNHRKGVERLVKIIRTLGYENISTEAEQVEIFIEFLGRRTYTFDIEATDGQGWKYCFECDGVTGHSSRRDRAKDKARDWAMLQIGIKTVRIQTIDLVGKRGRYGKWEQEPCTDEEIVQEIRHQLVNDAR
jgi:hypothetical protein